MKTSRFCNSTNKIRKIRKNQIRANLCKLAKAELAYARFFDKIPHQACRKSPEGTFLFLTPYEVRG